MLINSYQHCTIVTILSGKLQLDTWEAKNLVNMQLQFSLQITFLSLYVCVLTAQVIEELRYFQLACSFLLL